MKQIILMVCVAVLLAPTGLYAQKVYNEGGKAILDLTVAAGMPTGAVTNSSKTAEYARFSPSNNSLGIIYGTNNNESNIINATVYRKLEISKVNSENTTWVDGFNYCKNLTTDGGGWRLPTQRELILMFIFKPALDDIIVKDLSGATFFGGNYWSATENKATSSWVVYFGTGNTYQTSKDIANRARCVREVN